MAQCPRHPGSVATDMCVECGEMVCGQCAWVTPDRRVFCPNCKARGQQAPPPAQEEPSIESLLGVEPAPPPKAKPQPKLSPRREWSPKVVPQPPATKNTSAAIWSLILPILCCGWGAPVGFFLAIRERNLIKEGKSTSSPGLVTAAIVINALSLGWGLLLLVINILAAKSPP